MISIVVYGDNNTFITECVKSVDVSLFNCGVKYHIDKYDSYTDKMDLIIRDGVKKIYILDKDSRVSGLKIASMIRKYDYDSIIIMVSKYKNDLFNNKIMALDFICINDNYEERLVDDIRMAVSIMDKHNKVFTFKYNRVVYLIPFSDITYIEKESNVKRCIIHTINNKYYITGSLSSILEQLDDSFCRTHQSCIVNLNNIEEMKLGNNMLIFKNSDKTDMVTSKMKKEIKKYIGVS